MRPCCGQKKKCFAQRQALKNTSPFQLRTVMGGDEVRDDVVAERSKEGDENHLGARWSRVFS